METRKPVARAAAAVNGDWESALRQVLAEIGGDQREREERPDAVLLFVAADFSARMPEIVERVYRETGAQVLIGCSGIGVIGGDRELERLPALAMLQLSLPGGSLRAVRLTQAMVERTTRPELWRQEIGLEAGDVRGWLLYADPFHTDAEALIAGLADAYPTVPIVGGLASAGPLERQTSVFLNGEAFQDGAVALAIGGDYDLVSVVSQGCEPIGETWTITGVQDHWIESISNRPAIEVMLETLNGLPDYIQTRARQNMLAGLAIDEYRHDYRRGDFLVRNIVGIDRGSGAIAVGALARVGQTIQFQMRDAATANLDLGVMLDDLKIALNGQKPIAAILNTCNGRGVNLFGTSHHDASMIGKKFNSLPLAGLFCAGEIGPIGGKPYLHGFTASVGVIVPRVE